MAVYNSKDKLAYFKDNKQSPQENQDDYDMTKYYYNRDGIPTTEQQMLQQHLNYSHSDSNRVGSGIGLAGNSGLGSGNNGGYNPYMGPQGGLGYPMHSQVQQQRVPMPQLQARSQSGGTPSGMTDYSNIPQMQRSITTPYGVPNQQMYQQLPLNRVGQNDERINSNGVYGLSRVADSGLQYDTNNFPVLSSQQTRYSGGINNPYPSGNAPQREDEFHNLNDDDFPALPGSHKSHLRNDISDDFNHSMELHNGAPNRPPNNAMFYPNASSSGNIHPPSPGLYPSSNTTPTITPNRPKPFTLSPKLTASSEGSTPLRPEAKFGLLGLLDVIRLTDRDLNILALGSDLTTYGLNLNSSDCLYASFASPFSDHSPSSEPQFSTPNCYLMHPPTPKPEHMGKFLVETLFYMFFAMPKDVLQISAAQELYRREWRWHSELRIWLKPRTPQEQMQSHPGVHYVYFDPSAWEARLFTSTTRNPLASGFLSEEELRGKPVTSSSPSLPSAPTTISGT